MRRCLTMLMIIILLAGATCHPVAAGAAATPIHHQSEADALVSLGLLQGSSSGLLLNQTSTRLQGAVMLVRLLGQEKAVTAQPYSHPYTDIPAWGNGYIGYLYTQDLCSGIGPDVFGAQANLSTQQYLAFLLRVLGYDEEKGDFSWNSVWLKAVQVQLADQSEIEDWQQNPVFLRDDLALLTYRALGLKLKGSNTYLLDWLLAKNPSSQVDEVLRQQILNKSVAIPGIPRFSDRSSDAYYVSSRDQLSSSVENALMNLKPHIRLYIEDYQGDAYLDFEAILPGVLNRIDSRTGMTRLLDTWSYNGDMLQMDVDLKYVYSRAQFVELDQKIAQICQEVLKPRMSDYDIEKALHDYLVNYTQYDYQNMINNTLPESAYTPYGVLIKQSGVCQGYAEAMHLLCTQAGLDSQMITGTATVDHRTVSHAWNLVNIDGAYYHIDVSWDDLLLDDREVLRYTYFNCTDEEMEKDHTWDRTAYVPCTTTTYNYHVFNRLLEPDYAAFKKRVQTALLKRADRIDLKVDRFRYGDYGNLSGVMRSDYGVRSYTYNVDEYQGVVLIFNIRYR